jgi:CelD/BcsL family acetyltransferase involved in cellulose biosynthesis
VTVHGNVGKEEILTVQRLPGPEAWDDLTAEWELLRQKIAPPTPFTSPLWINLWWKHFRRHSLLFRDEFFCHIIRDDSGRLVALAPLMRTLCLGLGLPVMRIVQFFGNDPSLTEFRGVICRPEDHEKVIEALAAHFLLHRDEWDVFRWNGLHHTAATYNSPSTRGEFIARDQVADYIVEVPASWDALKAGVSSNMRKNLRKAYEFVERDGFRFQLRVVERPGEIDAATDRFLLLHDARSKAADMVFHPNKFAASHTRAFLGDYLRQLAERSELRIFELEVERKVVATRLAFLIGSDLYLYFAGYDTSWRQYSVMTILMSEIIKWSMAHHIQRINLSTGNDQSKLRWKPAEIIFHNAVQISPTSRGRLAFSTFLAYEALIRGRQRFAQA